MGQMSCRRLLDRLLKLLDLLRVINLVFALRIHSIQVMLPEHWLRRARAMTPRQMRLRSAIDKPPMNRTDALLQKNRQAVRHGGGARTVEPCLLYTSRCV